MEEDSGKEEVWVRALRRGILGGGDSKKEILVKGGFWARGAKRKDSGRGLSEEVGSES